MPELDPDCLADTRPGLRDVLLRVKELHAIADIRGDTVCEIETDTVLTLIVEVESLWRTLIDADRTLESALLN